MKPLFNPIIIITFSIKIFLYYFYFLGDLGEILIVIKRKIEHFKGRGGDGGDDQHKKKVPKKFYLEQRYF